jgi:hypothetical protein
MPVVRNVPSGILALPLSFSGFLLAGIRAIGALSLASIRAIGALSLAI